MSLKLISKSGLCYSQAANGVIALLAKAFKKQTKNVLLNDGWHCEWRWKAADVLKTSVFQVKREAGCRRTVYIDSPIESSSSRDKGK